MHGRRDRIEIRGTADRDRRVSALGKAWGVALIDGVVSRLKRTAMANSSGHSQPDHPRRQIGIGRFQDRVIVAAQKAMGVHLPRPFYGKPRPAF